MAKKYGARAWSSMIVKRMEDLNKIDFRTEGFPEELIDIEPEEKGYEI
jgi:3-hydroxyisobutyrate dehydrogenase